MKMEVLSVQNHHIKKQFNVIGSAKVKKDWTSSLSPLTSATTPTSTNLQASPSSTTTAVCNSFHSPIEHFDVVDGNNKQQHSTYNSHDTSDQSHARHLHASNFEMETTKSASPKIGIETSGTTLYTYNNNLLCCSPNIKTVDTSTLTTASAHTSFPSALTGIPIDALTPSPASSNMSTPTEATEHFGIANDDNVDATVVNELSQRLQAELRSAKSRHLSCTEVSLPWDLTPRIAAEMIKTSEREPCGVRGCAIFIDFEDETGSARRIASFKVDPNTVSTFELFLTLKQDKGGWTSLLPQFLKNLTRSSTILISPHFTLNKHKLYACE